MACKFTTIQDKFSRDEAQSCLVSTLVVHKLISNLLAGLYELLHPLSVLK